MNSGITEIRKDAQQEPYVRILVCRTCKTIDKLPPYEGPAEQDVTLQLTVEKHGETHMGRLINVSVLHWESETLRAEIIKQIWGGSSGLDVFGTNFYATRDQFADDAMKCYNAHLRPKDGCGEFRGEHKRLLPGTNAERKDLGLSPVQNSTGPKVYTCDWCPIRSVLARKQYDKGSSK